MRLFFFVFLFFGGGSPPLRLSRGGLKNKKCGDFSFSLTHSIKNYLHFLYFLTLPRLAYPPSGGCPRHPQNVNPLLRSARPRAFPPIGWARPLTRLTRGQALRSRQGGGRGRGGGKKLAEQNFCPPVARKQKLRQISENSKNLMLRTSLLCKLGDF